MRKKLIASGSVVEKTKDEIKKLAPWSQDIQVKVTQRSKGLYRTLISVKTKEKRNIADEKPFQNESCFIKEILPA